MESERKIHKFLDLAKKLSYKSSYHHKIGAVVAKKNKIISLGFNKPNKTHPASPNRFKTYHAEFDAIIGIDKKDLVGSTIYIFREHKNGNLASAKPCSDCAALIAHCGIKKVVYSDYNDIKEYVV